MNLAELLTIPASMFPDQEMLRFEGRGTSYAGLCERVARTAGALRALGVLAGDRVAALEINTPAMIEALYATAGLGAAFVPLNYRARADELAHLLGVAAPRVLLVGDRYLDTVRELGAARAEGPQLATLEHPAEGVPHLPALAEQSAPVFPAEVADEDLAVLMFTSGTTAAAKAVMLAHADLVAFVFNTTEPADGSDRGAVLLAAPLHHIAGLTAALAATFAGRRIVLLRQFEAEAWLHLVETERVTHAFLVPTMLKRVLDSPHFAAPNLASLQVLSYGAAPMPLPVIRRAIEVFPPAVQFINAFGQTETTSTVAVLGPEDHRLEGAPEEVERKLRRLASIGRPLPDVELRILDDQSRALPPGQVGEIAIRTERLMRGYYGQEAATRATVQDGWLRTRDLGWMDEDGYVYLAGRASDLIIRGGENIAPQEVEAVLASHPAVEEAAVIGLPDEEWGEQVAAVVVRRPGVEVSAEALVEHCRQRLASFKRPQAVVFADALPRNALGKLLRQELREQASRQPPAISHQRSGQS
ncbi:MAG: AMP-binding protein [Chloroflexi bacterium]|nr:AMP-binding protein [Chloroflexota bacterium]